MATNSKDAFNPSHAGPFVIGRHNLVFLFLCVASTRLQYAAFIALFAPKLLAATCVMTILDDIQTATGSTLMLNDFCYHDLTISLPLDHYQKIKGRDKDKDRKHRQELL